jgi:dolichol-phosphate mannosyltransferase
MSLSALIRNYKIVEIPISWYGRTWGSSSLRLTQMGRRYLATLLKVFADRLLITDDLIAERESEHAHMRYDYARPQPGAKPESKNVQEKS